MVNINMCLVYRFSKLCNNVALYDKLNDSPLIDLVHCYEKKNSALTILPYSSIEFHFGNHDKPIKMSWEI